jgi:hypothetical protein
VTGPHAAARAWLWLAVLAVATSGMFAILIVLARVPALGTLFPGTQFYRVALTMHVNLSQLVWFSAFAALLWSRAARRPGSPVEMLAVCLCGAGALAVILTPALGAVTALTANYLPVLDSPLFLAGIAVFGGGLLLQSLRGLGVALPGAASADPAGRLGLVLAAAASTTAIALLPWSSAQLSTLDGYSYFEALFWGSGHVWQCALVLLMMLSWRGILGGTGLRAERALPALLVLAALPVPGALAIQSLHPAGEAAYLQAFTDLMRYTSWEAPLLLGLLLLGCKPAANDWGTPVFHLSLLLFVCGLLLGATISGQTTLVTAHYHGTIGAVTLSFMGYSYRLLPALGLGGIAAAAIRRQTACYGWGNLLMMAGLAGAGWMGAPRKAPGQLGFDFGAEALSRIVMGVGGCLALAGILGFAWLLLRALRPLGAARPLLAATP